MVLFVGGGVNGKYWYFVVLCRIMCSFRWSVYVLVAIGNCGMYALFGFSIVLDFTYNTWHLVVFIGTRRYSSAAGGIHWSLVAAGGVRWTFYTNHIWCKHTLHNIIVVIIG